MSNLKYTDGSNGNGLTDVHELLAYLTKYEGAFLDVNFMSSYQNLLLRGPASVRTAVVRLVTEVVAPRFPAFSLLTRPWFIALGGRPPAEALSQMLAAINGAQDTGDRYYLCESCGGEGPLNPQCYTMCLRLSEGAMDWCPDETQAALCGVNQILRNLDVSLEEQRRIVDETGIFINHQERVGLECNVCKASEKQKALKMCGRCKKTYYCSPECQKNDWTFHKRFCNTFIYKKNKK